MANGDQAQQFTPAEFSAKIKAKYPQYASIPDEQLVAKITAKYPQYKSQIKAASENPLVTGKGMMERAMVQAHDKAASAPMHEVFSGKPATQVPVPSYVHSELKGAPQGLAGMLIIGVPGAAAEAAGGGFGGAIIGGAAGGGTSSVSSQILEHKNPLSMESLKQTTNETLLGGAAGATLYGAGKVAGKVLAKADPLARINKLLGVGPKEIRVGQVPESLDDFASNPARGVQKAGIEEKQLAKMNPLERLRTVTQARNAAGAKLDQVLQSPQNASKTIDVSKVLKDTFSQIPDKNLAKLATKRVTQLLAKQGITKPLSQLSPMEARTFQRSLDDFANFASEGTVKSFSDIATSLRRGISQATRKAIPETAALDMDYGDLAGATKAANRAANKYARTANPSILRKAAIAGASAAGAGIAGATGYELAKHSILPF